MPKASPPSLPVVCAREVPEPGLFGRIDRASCSFICRSEGHFSAIAVYGFSSFLARPYLRAYSRPSSMVAPSQPPVPPQLRGFAVQESISCAEKVRPGSDP